MDRKLITLNFSMEQVCNDVLARCYVVSQGMVDEAQKDIRANIESPDSDETRSIINRAVTEAIANIKLAAQRFAVNEKSLGATSPHVMARMYLRLLIFLLLRFCLSCFSPAN